MEPSPHPAPWVNQGKIKRRGNSSCLVFHHGNLTFAMFSSCTGGFPEALADPEESPPQMKSSVPALRMVWISPGRQGRGQWQSPRHNEFSYRLNLLPQTALFWSSLETRKFAAFPFLQYGKGWVGPSKALRKSSLLRFSSLAGRNITAKTALQ